MKLRDSISIRIAQAVLVVVGMAASHSAFAQNYSLTDLGTLGGASSTAYAVNSTGVVVGVADTASAVSRAFVWDKTRGMRDLGTLKGDLTSIAASINDAGEIAGISTTAVVEKFDKKSGWVYYVSTEHAVTWSSSLTIKKLGTGEALGINSNGQVVGFVSANATLWNPNKGSSSNLGTLGGSPNQSAAIGINGRGQVVGYAPINDSDQTQHAFLWTPTTPNGTSGSMRDLGTLNGTPGYPSLGTAVNAIGQVVGSTSSLNAGGGDRAFLYTVGTMYDLGVLVNWGDTNANAINASGQVVGTAQVTDITPQHPHGWVWTPTAPNGSTGAMVDLNSRIPTGTGWVITNANAINDAGLIVGDGSFNGQIHAILLTPQ